MARIVGNLRPEDDYTHPLGPERNFNESMYFNFFDGGRGLGGFLRLGNRANEGSAELTACLFLPEGRVLFAFERPSIPGNQAFDAGGMRFDVIEPTQRLRTRFQGTCLELAEPRAMAEPGRAFRESPKRRVVIDLLHEAVGPLYGRSGGLSENGEPAERQFAKAHSEQHMHVTGTLAVDEQKVTIDGYGLRDHSWGPRTWQAIHRYEWLTMNFGAELGAMVSVVQRDPEGHKITRGGVVVRGDTLDPIVEAAVDAAYEENGLYHKTVRTRVKTLGGESLEILGDVKSFIPLRNRRGSRVTHIGEGMTEWRLGTRIGHGLSEFLRQVT